MLLIQIKITNTIELNLAFNSKLCTTDKWQHWVSLPNLLSSDGATFVVGNAKVVKETLH